MPSTRTSGPGRRLEAALGERDRAREQAVDLRALVAHRGEQALADRRAASGRGSSRSGSSRSGSAPRATAPPRPRSACSRRTRPRETTTQSTRRPGERHEVDRSQDGLADRRRDQDADLAREAERAAASQADELLGLTGSPPCRSPSMRRRSSCVRGSRFHQRLDVEVVAGAARHPAGRGVRLLEVAALLEVGHDVADGRRRDPVRACAWPPCAS